MSSDAANQFLNKAMADQALQQEINAAVAGKDEAAAAEAVVAIGRTHGYEFSADEVQTARAAVKERLSRELSDQDLQSVSGGNSFFQW
jgi:predicted ribosomally synthesized peptide with nif11-like leader